MLGANERRVHREKHDTLVPRGTQTGNDPRERDANVAAVVDDRERQLELSVLADRNPLFAELTEGAPSKLGERAAFELRERLRRSETPTRPADEQDSGDLRYPARSPARSRAPPGGVSQVMR